MWRSTETRAIEGEVMMYLDVSEETFAQKKGVFDQKWDFCEKMGTLGEKTCKLGLFRCQINGNRQYKKRVLHTFYRKICRHFTNCCFFARIRPKLCRNFYLGKGPTGTAGQTPAPLLQSARYAVSDPSVEHHVFTV
jgi:hypothetical protein